MIFSLIQRMAPQSRGLPSDLGAFPGTAPPRPSPALNRAAPIAASWTLAACAPLSLFNQARRLAAVKSRPSRGPVCAMARGGTRKFLGPMPWRRLAPYRRAPPGPPGLLAMPHRRLSADQSTTCPKRALGRRRLVGGSACRPTWAPQIAGKRHRTRRSRWRRAGLPTRLHPNRPLRHGLPPRRSPVWHSVSTGGPVAPAQGL